MRIVVGNEGMLINRAEYHKEEAIFHGFIPRIMGTRFDLLMMHPDGEDADLLWWRVMDRLEVLDRVFNRFDATGEVAKLNALCPTEEWMEVSEELNRALVLCDEYYRKTERLFDITLRDFALVEHDAERFLVRFAEQDVTLDFGGFAKGYALREVKRLLEEEGVENAFVDFGRSSLLALGHHPYGDCWKVAFNNPYTGELIKEFELRGVSMSTSGNTADYAGHIINPITGDYENSQVASTVLSPSPLDAEVLSTVWLVADEDERQTIVTRFADASCEMYEL